MKKPKTAETPGISPALKGLAVPIDSVHLDPDNARAHPEWNLDAIKRSYARFGQQRPIVVDSQGTIRAGNGQWLAAKALGWTHIAAVTTDLAGADLTAFAIADNRTGELSVWNEDALAKALAGIGADLAAAAGFSQDDLAKRLGEQAHARDEVLPIKETPPISQPGDVWTLGEHRLLVGDCTIRANWEMLLGKARAALVHTDPPYGVSYQNAKGESIQGDTARDDKLLALLGPALTNAAAYADDAAAFYVWHASSTRRDFEAALTAAGLIEIQYLIWTKPSPNMGRADYQWAHEPCFYAAKQGQSPAFYADRTQQTVWRMDSRSTKGVAITAAGGIVILDGTGGRLYVDSRPPSKKKTRKIRIADGQALAISADAENTTVWELARDRELVHPNQKPVALAERAIQNSTRAGELVVDPFMGSGTTLIAAEITGRKAAGFEIDPKYADRIVARWEGITGKKAERTQPEAKPKKGKRQ